MLWYQNYVVAVPGTSCQLFIICVQCAYERLSRSLRILRNLVQMKSVKCVVAGGAVCYFDLKNPWWWQPGARTCSRKIFILNPILLSELVGWYSILIITPNFMALARKWAYTPPIESKRFCRQANMIEDHASCA